MAPTVAVTRDTYVRLAQLKRPGETFNDVIRRLAGRPDLMRYAGSISDADGRQLRAVSNAIRTDFDADLERRARKRSGSR